MAIVVTAETGNAHWYTPEGQAMHTVETAAGGTRRTYIGDARKRGLYPSVTAILGILDKPALTTWKIEQALIASEAMPRPVGEDVASWRKRVVDASYEQVEKAADVGTTVHAAIAAMLAGQPTPPDLEQYLAPVRDWLDGRDVRPAAIEQVVTNRAEGYAGTVDLAFRYGRGGVGILDWKTRKTTPGREVEQYDGQAMQLAAYAAAYWGVPKLPIVLAANLFISSTEPGRIDVVKCPNLVAAYDAFRAAAVVWRYQKSYDPRVL